jgi:hypothetical protein
VSGSENWNNLRVGKFEWTFWIVKNGIWWKLADAIVVVKVFCGDQRGIDGSSKIGFSADVRELGQDVVGQAEHS